MSFVFQPKKHNLINKDITFLGHPVAWKILAIVINTVMIL